MFFTGILLIAVLATGIWALLSFLVIVFLLRYKALSALVWLAIAAYILICGAVVAALFHLIGSVGIEHILPSFSAPY